MSINRILSYFYKSIWQIYTTRPYIVSISNISFPFLFDVSWKPFVFFIVRSIKYFSIYVLYRSTQLLYAFDNRPFSSSPNSLLFLSSSFMLKKDSGKERLRRKKKKIKKIQRDEIRKSIANSIENVSTIRMWKCCVG